MPKQRLTTRGKIVVGIALAVAIWFVSTQLWVTNNGVCVGDIVKCVYGGK